jgi:hypothetical protein
MTKPSRSFYSTAIEHKEMPGCYMASFATPGEAPLWVNGPEGKPRVFRDAAEAELAGYRVMVTRLNRARNVQTFQTQGYKPTRGIKAFRSDDIKMQEPTVETVFGKR